MIKNNKDGTFSCMDCGDIFSLEDFRSGNAEAHKCGETLRETLSKTREKSVCSESCYKILISDSTCDLEEQVGEKINDGWTAQGGICVQPGNFKIVNCVNLYLQAIVKWKMNTYP